MPAYDTYLPGLYKDGPQRGMARPELLVPAGSSANSEGGGQSALSPVLKVSYSALPDCVVCSAFRSQHFLILLFPGYCGKRPVTR